MLISFKHSRPSSSRGFTLIELIVTSAIILIITTVVFFQQAKFNSSTLLRSLTYSMALSVRQAQVYGTSVRESAPGSGFFAQGYGVYFPATGVGANTFYLFPDVTPSPNGNGSYDSASEGPPVGIGFTLGKGYVINTLCAVAAGGSTCTSVSSLTVFFRRPNPDACISTAQALGACAVGTDAVYSAAYIQLKSTGNNDTRSIKVTSTGQIAVCAPNLSDVTQC